MNLARDWPRGSRRQTANSISNPAAAKSGTLSAMFMKPKPDASRRSLLVSALAQPHFAYGPLGGQEYELAHAMDLANHLSQFSAVG